MHLLRRIPYYKRLREYLEPDLLILDELGFQKFPQYSVNDFFEVIAKRYEKGSLIITTNQPFEQWGNIFGDSICATIMTRKHRASTVLKRLSSYSNQHPLQEALKEFGRIIKTIFVLKYIDDVALRQTIEKQLNKGELANKFAAAVSFANQEMTEAYQEDQEIAAICKTILQNIIILWNYVELTQIIMRSDKADREILLNSIANASIITWQHVNMLGIYDFSNLLAANDNVYTPDEVINYKVA